MRNSFKPPLDFIGYIQNLPVTDTELGVFISEAKSDLNLVNARSWKQLRKYFDDHSVWVRDDVYTSAWKVWRKFRARYPAYLEPDI